MKLFLSDHLHVPDSHIVFLSNETATRAAILSTIQTHLIENPNVKQDDAIIVFYAGHGSRVDAPPGWASADGKIETICPYDEWAQDIQGHYISGIPDRTINELFRKLASEKGNNIVRTFTSWMSSCSNINGFRLLSLIAVILEELHVRIGPEMNYTLACLRILVRSQDTSMRLSGMTIPRDLPIS